MAARFSSTMRTVVVVPAFNEEQAIFRVVSGILRCGHDAVVVDDGSSDATGAEARRGGAVVLRHPINRGYGAALTTGTEWAARCGYDVVVHFDADGQHDPDEISAVAAPIRAGEADVAIGSRFLGAALALPWRRKLLIRLAVLFTRVVSRVRLTDAHNGFRALSAEAARRLDCREDGMGYASELVERVARQGLRLCEVPVTITYSEYSTSKGEGNLAKLRVGARFLWSKLIH